MIGFFVGCVAEMIVPSGRKRRSNPRSTTKMWVLAAGVVGPCWLLITALSPPSPEDTKEVLIGIGMVVFAVIGALWLYFDAYEPETPPTSPPPPPEPSLPRPGPVPVNRERPADRPHPWRTWEG